MSATVSSPPTSPRLGFGVTPSTVQDAANRADEMIREMQAQQGQSPATPPAESPQGEGSEGTGEGVSSPANAGGEGMQPTSEPALPASPPAEGFTASPNSEIETLRAQIKALEQDARTWRGRYDTELPRERQMRQQAESQLAALTTRLEALEAAKPAPAQDYEPLSTDEIDQYGADMFAMIERALMPKVLAQVSAALSGLNMRFDRIEGNLTQTTSRVAHTEQEKFYARIDERVSGWREVDENPAFHAWLKTADPIFGEPYENALAKAARIGDDAAVSKVFEAFLNQQDASGSRVPSRGAPRSPAPGTGETPTAPQAAASPSLESLAAPGKPSPAPSPANGGQPGAKRNWTQDSIRQFYADQARGVYRDRAAEADQIEREIAAAMRENRIRA